MRGTGDVFSSFLFYVIDIPSSSYFVSAELFESALSVLELD
jgi:hypothetical protein